ncbi:MULTISPECIES: maleylpyruvate isomerase family mycothiol-dependent enzyme [unclassified Nocardioides]|uniref:maleylpyruvate isomerase family mycothiol-dependent enzyme n=1 Tax=unclassified Nocardioides TaxID=2615069 RepID=UPI0036102938
MTPEATKFLETAERFSATTTDVADWSAQSPCDDWTAADVVGHVVDTQREFLTQHGADLGDRPSGSPEEVWSAHLAAVRPVVADDAYLATTYDGWFGPTTVGETVVRFYGLDLVVHGWDIASSQGAPTTFSDDDMDAMEKSFVGFGDAMYAPGVFSEDLPVPDDADRQTKLLARMGRRA